MKKWLNKYENGGELNYNDSQISIPPNYVGQGYNTKGRNYSPAWGGQFADGGNLVAKQDATKVVIPKTTKDSSNFKYTSLDKRIHELIPQYEYPENYGLIWDALTSIVTNTPLYGDSPEFNSKYGKGSGAGDELFKYALGYSGKLNYIESSPYKPSRSKDLNSKYLRVKNLDKTRFLSEANKELGSDSTKVVNWGMVPSTDIKNSHGLGNFTIGRGEDKDGKYLSYYDKYDFNTPIVNSILDRTPEVYDRVYYKDNSYNKRYEKLRAIQDSLWKTETEDNRRKSIDIYEDILKLNDETRSEKSDIISKISVDNKDVDYSKYFKLENGGTVNPYQEMTRYSPLPKKEDDIYNIIKSPMQAYSFSRSLEDLNDNTPPTGTNLIKLNDVRTIDQATGNKINTNNRFNYNVHRDTVKEIIEGAIERGIDPQTALAMALQESGISRMNYFNDRNAGLQGIELSEEEKSRNDGNQEIRKIAEKYPSGVSRKQWNASGFDTIKKQFDLAKKLGKTTEEDIIQSFNGYGNVTDLYGVPGITNMSKNPLYGKRVIDFRENIIKKNPEIMNLLNTYSKKMKNGGEIINVFRTGDAIAQTGTTIPGSTYARIGDIPSNGKHARKTLPSAEDGIELKQLQDFTNNPKWLEKYK